MTFAEPHLSAFTASDHHTQGAINSAPVAWAEDLEDVPHRDQLPTAPIDRHQLWDLCRNPENPVLFGYVCAMAWGGQEKGPGGRRKVKAAWSQRAKLVPILEKLRTAKLPRKEAFESFCDDGLIGSLGVSYFTKLLYFFGEDRTCYIMDQWTGKSINLLMGLHVVRIYDQSPTRDNKGGNYQAFCEAVDALSQLIHQSGAETEERLMSRRGGSWRNHVKAHYPYDKSALAKAFPHIPLQDF